MRRRRSPGFSLIEITFALGVASFTFITILGLLPLGLNMQRSTVEETSATNIATAINADLHQAATADALSQNSTLNTKSPQYGIDVTQASTTIYLDSNGTLKTSAVGAHYKVTIALTVPTATTPTTRTATYGTITIGSPAAAATPVNSVSVFVALDRN